MRRMTTKSSLVVFLCLISSAVTQDPTTDEQEYFIKQIFDLYGDTNHLSFEGFEHLMENLGLGGLKFDKSHNLSMHKVSDGKFIEVHDTLKLHTHNHTREKRSLLIKSMEEKCLSPETLLSLYGLEPGHQVSISPQGFMRICPAIVYQLDRRACSPPEIFIEEPIGNNISTQAWLGASVSILIISISGLVGVVIAPCLDKSFFRRLLSALVALAVGTLCGDALIHLLPHAYGMKDDLKSIMRSSATFLALMAFFIVESIINLKAAYKTKKKLKKEKGFSPSYQTVDTTDGHNHNNNEGIASVAWMIVSGDGLHNLTDGLAVGAAFRADLVSGLATAVAVFTHELPHELGDFAVLLKSGMSVKKAILYNMFSSVLSFVGMVIGLLLGNIESATSWIYCITAGSFLYIGLADLVPELHKSRQKDDAMCNFILQLIGIFTGGVIMFIIAVYEHDLHDFLTSM